MTAPLCFLDIETDGVHPDRKAWEIACIRRDPDGTETEWHAYVDIDLSTADPFGLRVGRFYDRHPLGRYLQGTDNQDPRPLSGETTFNFITGEDRLVSLPAAAAQIARLTHGAHIIGVVPNFDTEVLDNLLRAHGLTPGWHYHLVDIENLAVGYLAAQGTPLAPPWNSDALTEALAVEPGDPEERDTALGDARWAMRVYDAVMQTHASMAPSLPFRSAKLVGEDAYGTWSVGELLDATVQSDMAGRTTIRGRVGIIRWSAPGEKLQPLITWPDEPAAEASS